MHTRISPMEANQEQVEEGYDGYFILQELYKQHVTNSSQVVNGAKILGVEIPNVKFINSMNFFPMALSDFQKHLESVN